MTHYVCTGGCGAMSDMPGSCQTESCSLYGQPFKACDCGDGKHEQAYASSEAVDSQAEK